MAIAKAGAITSFAVVSPNSRLLSQTSSDSVDNGMDMIPHERHSIIYSIFVAQHIQLSTFPYCYYAGLLRINPATPINDYYRNNVQTIHALSTSELLFEGIIDYEIAHSECAVHSQASWVVLDPLGAMGMGGSA